MIILFFKQIIKPPKYLKPQSHYIAASAFRETLPKSEAAESNVQLHQYVHQPLQPQILLDRPLPHKSNRWVFSFLLKVVTLTLERMSKGRPFHRRGATYRKRPAAFLAWKTNHMAEMSDSETSDYATSHTYSPPCFPSPDRTYFSRPKQCTRPDAQGPNFCDI